MYQCYYLTVTLVTHLENGTSFSQDHLENNIGTLVACTETQNNCGGRSKERWSNLQPGLLKYDLVLCSKAGRWNLTQDNRRWSRGKHSAFLTLGMLPGIAKPRTNGNMWLSAELCGWTALFRWVIGSVLSCPGTPPSYDGVTLWGEEKQQAEDLVWEQAAPGPCCGLFS